MALSGTRMALITILWTVRASAGTPGVECPGECAKLHRNSLAGARTGDIRQVLSRLSPLLSDSASPDARICAGVILSGVSELLSAAARFRDAEAFARRALLVLRKELPEDDTRIAGALHALAAALVEQGKLNAARAVTREMEASPAVRGDDVALVHQMHARLFAAEGNQPQAEAATRAALAAWEHAGLGGTIGASDLLYGLSMMHLKGGKPDDAQRLLDQAMAIAASSHATIPADWVRLLNARAAIRLRAKDWNAAETDFLEAIRIADNDPGLDSGMLVAVLNNYGQLLRETRRKRRASEFEKRARAIERSSGLHSVVDASAFTEPSNALRPREKGKP